FGLPPFAAVRAEHFVPAFELAMRTHLEEVAAIGSASDAPNFANTIAALDRAGRLFDRISGLFHNLTSSETSPALQAIERQMAPLLAAHESRVSMDRPLFARIDALHKRRHELGLGAEQLRALERYHTDFVRAGARMGAAEQKRYAEVMQRLADLTTRFGQNVLADESGFQLVLNGEAELAGLPGFVRTAARQAAVDRGVAADGVVTLSRSHIVPFLTFSERRDLREQAWRAWTSRGEHEGASDNRGVAAEILALRLEQARLHGYASYADYALADTMAGSQEAVTSLLMQVWKPAQARALAEREALEALALSRGEPATIEPWDWRFHAEKVRRVRFHLDEAAVKPYFALERITEAAFDCAGRLFGLSFVPRPEIAVYHPDVKVYEVRGADGAAIGLFLHDNFARPTKRSGAWMGAYRMQSKNGGSGGDASVLPIIVNNNNFAKGAPGEPTLLSFDDARTLFHEFGHGLHGLLSNVTYERLSGTNVLRDFVELPSQLFEHWLEEPEVLKRHARHHATGEPIPDSLIGKLHAARHFNQGYETVRYTASALVDMAAHARRDEAVADVVAFERAELERIGLPSGVGLNHRLTHFQHLFSGSGYAAGYYVYLWAEVLDADGFEAFVEAGNPFDAAVAKRLVRFIYSAGNSIEPGAAYRAFRGRAATPEPMLKQRGLVEEVIV
ncbi:MAG: M3 family metallopeptidase, partial [Caldimonas sp.]